MRPQWKRLGGAAFTLGVFCYNSIMSHALSTYRLDTKIISRNWSKINASPIKRSGLLCRKLMRQSIRKAHVSTKTGKVSIKPSKPGKPPKSRAAGHPPRLVFSVPVQNDTDAVVGVVGFRKGDPTVPEAHEFGRTITRKVPKWKGGRQRNKAKSEKQRKAASKHFGQLPKKRHDKPRMTMMSIRVQERPFAAPALAKTSEKMTEFWKGSFNKRTVKSKVK